jgi:integrase
MASENDKREFLELAAQAFESLQRKRESSKAKTIAELWDTWIATDGASGKNTSRVYHRRYLAIPCALDGESFTVLGLRWPDFDRAHVDAWREALAATKGARTRAPLSPASRDQIRLSLQACFSYHQRHTKLVTSNPLRDVPREDNNPPRRKGYFTPEDLERFLKHCPPILAAMIRVSARCAGLRREAVRLLAKDQIDWAAGEIVYKNKGGAEKRALMTSDAMEEIRSWSRLSPGRLVFPAPRDPTGNRPVAQTTFSRWMREAGKASGVSLMGESPVFHHARHGWTMAMAPVAPLNWIADQLGHADTKQVEARYAHLRGAAKEQLREWMNQSPLGGPDKPKTG